MLMPYSVLVKLKPVKTQLAIFLLCFAAFLLFKDKDAAFITATIIAVISSLISESAILYFKNKVFTVTASSLITGLIIGYVLSGDEPWWKFVLASGLAVVSKYLIRFQRKHIFNPAAFGIFLTVIFGTATQWEGTYIWYILLPFGIYFSRKFRKLEIIIGYAVVSLLLFGIQAFLQKVPLAHVFGYFSYFYICIMIIEPKTTPVTVLGKYLFGAGIAGFIFVLTGLGAKFDVELFSLLMMNITVPLFNRMAIAKGG